jgi:hypothetical protein
MSIVKEAEFVSFNSALTSVNYYVAYLQHTNFITLRRGTGSIADRSASEAFLH